MLRISISKTGTPTRTSSFDKREITLGRTAANDLVIAEPGVSGNHARILYLDGELTLIDLDSTNGTFVNGQRIQGPHIVRPGDDIYICAHRLTFETDPGPELAGSRPPSLPPPLGSFPGAGATSGPPPVFPTLPPPTLGDRSHDMPPVAPEDTSSLPPLMSAPDPFPPRLDHEEFPAILPPVADSLPAFPEEPVLPDLPPVLPSYPGSGSSVPRFDPAIAPSLPAFTESPSSVPPSQILDTPGPAKAPSVPSSPLANPALERLYDDTFLALVHEFAAQGQLPSDTPQLRTRVRTRVKELLAPRATEHPDLDTGEIAQKMTDELLDLDRLSVCARSGEDVVLRGPQGVQSVRPEGRSGHAQPVTFSCRRALEHVVRRATGRRFDAEHPVITASTPNGTIVHAIHDVLAPEGPLVLLHGARPASGVTRLDDLVQRRVASAGTAALLRASAQAGLCVLVASTPGADALELCTAVVHANPPNSRQAWVSNIVQPAGTLPGGTIVLHPAAAQLAETDDPRRLLVRAASGLAPDRLWVHDVAGREAADLLVLFGGSRIGGGMTVRASSAHDALERLATLASLGLGGDIAGLRRLVVQTVDLVVVIGRKADGGPVVTHVSEPQMSPAGAPHMQDLIQYDFRGGGWTRTGATPTFLPGLQQQGISVDFNSA